ncbi:NADPH-dependent F420 reductase [Candidatus Laterigemmans baculatus]|uniref:NADPH-dependent F420 reductase n=1 Tax=Candidatus Laterigemmans baculatus TaxID=2770505 RepID=UPI0013DAC27A|nr:NADPH-dependent F420 reductase [Candidatus Laterigemmans baculatus]
MEIAILGTGNVGRTLGRRWADAGHHIHYGSRNPTAERMTQLSGEKQSVDTIRDVIDRCGVVVLATPYGTAKAVLAMAKDLAGKILIDCTNPLNATFDGLELGFDDSAAERIASWAPGARVVKAFNTASVSTMQDPLYEGQAATMFYCGDDDEAKATVAQLVADLGMEPVDAGPLANARYLEPMAMLYIHLAVHQGWGGNCALKLLSRPHQ